MAGVLLRNSLDDLLARGCETPPRVIIHDEDYLNNFGEPVPGLTELADRHKKSLAIRGKRPYAVANALVDEARRGAIRPKSPAAAWLHASFDGVCHPIPNQPLRPRAAPARSIRQEVLAGCVGQSGSWRVDSTFGQERNLTMLATACLERCAACAPCNFLSVAIREYSCFWYSTCDLHKLSPLRGARTGPAMRKWAPRIRGGGIER